MNIERADILNRIRYLRLQKAMKQEELSRVINVSQASLSGYENEKYEPDKKTLLKLAAFFGVTVDYLLGIDTPADCSKAPCANIPVYKNLRADAPNQFPREIYYYQPVGPYVGTEGEYFGLQVSGDSMEPRICEGDVIIARRQADADTGDIVIVQVGTEYAAVTELVKYESGITLVSLNHKYHPRSFTNDEISSLPVVIMGKAVELRRRC
jgi:repressor LexA